MILAIDAGNTNIVLGCIEGERLLLTARISTDRSKTSDEYALILHSLLALHGLNPREVEGAIIASVVSELTDVLRLATEMITHKPPIMVGAGIKTGVNIKIDDPGQLGADLVVGAVAATAKYPKPLVIFDLGTADTMSVVDADGRFLGGAIMAGPRLSVDALSSRTSQLPRIDLNVPPATRWRPCRLGPSTATRLWWTACWTEWRRSWASPWARRLPPAGWPGWWYPTAAGTSRWTTT